MYGSVRFSPYKIEPFMIHPLSLQSLHTEAGPPHPPHIFKFCKLLLSLTEEVALPLDCASMPIMQLPATLIFQVIDQHDFSR